MANLRAKQQREAEAYVKKAGYARGGDVAQDKSMVRAGVGQHEGNMHRGKAKTNLKLATGGIVSGNETPARLDKRARGGGITPGLPGKSRGTNVNIMLHTADQEGRQKAAQQGMQQGAMLGAKAAMAKMGGAPPGAPGAPPGGAGGPPPGAPPGGPPGGGMMPQPRPPMPGMRPPGMKRGGRVPMKAGAGSGEGRLEKIKAQHSGKQRVRSYERKARGGKV